MKTLKRVQAFFFAMVMAIFSTGTTALAAETNETTVIDSNIVDVTYNDDGSVETTYEFEITPDKVNENGIALLSADVNQTFNMTTSHRGSSRSYNGNYLDVTVRVSDVNGNSVGTLLAIRLCDHQTEKILTEIQRWADGSTATYFNIPITSGTLYYFHYLVAYGSQQTLRVHMEITAHY